jgi:hypothetical protein
MKSDWFEELPATKTVLKWTVRIAFVVIAGLIIFYQWREAQVLRLAEIERVQKLQQLTMDAVIAEIQTSNETVKALIDKQNEEVKRLIKHESDKTNTQLKTIVQYVQIDPQVKTMLLEMIDYMRKAEPVVDRVDTLKIGVKKR